MGGTRIGIPTLYKGVQFRSRLEATWAAFFDALPVRWTYEPFDLAGYIPDFQLEYQRRPLLVEVKPDHEDLELAKLKLEASGWEHDAVIVVNGATRFVGSFWSQDQDLGWDSAVVAWCTACNAPTIVSESGLWACRNCGADSRALWWAYNTEPMWRGAQNAVQWRRPA